MGKNEKGDPAKVASNEKWLTGNQRRFFNSDYKPLPPSVQCRLCEPYRKRIIELERLAAALSEGFDRNCKGEL
jgi:hypothetical protein